jgi:Holliday junction DNA helicase RuvA
MISYLDGEIKYSDGQTIIIKTNSGVGYELNYAYFGQVGSEIELYCSFIIRENSQQLFGFKNFSDKKLFELLLDVNGVGPKSAYSLVVNIGLEKIGHAIQFDQKNILTEAPGIGKKTAEQIILSLRDKILKFNISEVKTIKTAPDTKLMVESNLINETMQALEGLGYKASDVISPLKLAFKEGMTSQDLLKKVLKEL